jgi:3-deoxy-D-manno-octulosonic-acid transferase
MLLLYRSAFAALLPLIGVRLLWKGRRDRRYWQHIAERFGRGTHDMQPARIWVHAASVGEVIAASTIIDRLLTADPATRVLVTTMTPTGREQIQQRYGKDPRVQYRYVPYDLRCAVRRFLRVLKPSVCVIMETELWPVLIDETHRQRIPILLANARLSQRSCRKYAKLRGFMGDTLSKIDRIAAQYAADARRFRFLLKEAGSRVTIAGSVKYDLLHRLAKDMVRHQHMWLAVSTHPGEEAIILDAFSQVRARYRDSVLLLAPRHVDRIPTLLGWCQEVVGDRVTTYSQQPDWQCVQGVVLIDQLGVLPHCYPLASVAFVGGSLVERGGQNPIEPAAYGMPVLMGPSRYNFHAITRAMSQAGILTLVHNSQDIAEAVIAYRDNPSAASALGEQAKQFVAAQGGAADQHIVYIKQLEAEYL